MKDHGKCKKCEKAATKRDLKLCNGCYKEYRKEQMAPVTAKWLARVKAGKASHRFVYRGKPTVAALKKPSQARAYYEKHGLAKVFAKLEQALTKQAEKQAEKAA